MILYKKDMKEVIKDISGALMTIAFMSCYIPQIHKIIKHEKSSDVSCLMIIFGLIGYITGLVYMYCNVFGLWWFLNYSTGIITSLVLLFYWYKHK
jgi:uncharacterized protein with PQ loop repeat